MHASAHTRPTDIALDSTGLKFYGAGEWDRAKHGERHSAEIAASGRMNWQKRHGYGLRSLVETGVGRIKRLNGGLLRARTFGAQRQEVALQIAVLNRMIRAAKPITIRVQ